MALTIPCDSCGDVLQEAGALLFGPPDAEGMVGKFHLCVGCYLDMREQMGKDGQP